MSLTKGRTVYAVILNGNCIAAYISKPHAELKRNVVNDRISNHAKQAVIQQTLLYGTWIK